ncbi:hypothetical protein LXA43DRAFT_854262, partial [Ganoderma leucocontextum]
RCKNLVPLTNSLRFPRARSLPVYCISHQSEALTVQCTSVTRRKFIPPSALLSQNLERQTLVALLHLMHRPPADYDAPGYIYALELRVGRSNDVPRRLLEHQRRCPSYRPSLIGYSSYVPNADRLERLVHIELTDRAAQS